MVEQLKNGGYDYHEIYSERPNHGFAQIKIDDLSNPRGLRDAAQSILHQRPTLKKIIRKRGYDAVAYASAHGRHILIGVGAITALGILAETGYILYRHRHPRSDR